MYNMKPLLAALLLAALPLTACDSLIGKEPDFMDTVTIARTSTPIAASGMTPTGKAADDAFVTALTDFSHTLFKKSLQKGKNAVLSPLSVTYALTLTANGAGGDTLSEFNSLNGGIDVTVMNEYLYSLTNSLAQTEESTVDIANSIWASSRGFALNSEFGKVVKDYFGAEGASLDFTDPSSPQIINEWVSDHTDGMIKKAVGEIDPMTVMILINTILFDGKWAEEYESSDIYAEPFTNHNGTESTPDFLHSTEHSYFEVENGVGFSKDYKDGYRFTAVLPDRGVDVYEFTESLDLTEVADAAKKGTEKVICAMPKFEYEVEADLNDILKSMGLTRAFDPSKAELYGVGSSDKGSISVSTKLQKAKIKLDEHGTKAAAMTQVSLMATSAGPSAMPKVITLDRPFFYMITDGETGIPLFLGILAETEKE